MIACVAVIGHQNNPLYIQSFTEADDALKLHHIVHCSLDVVEERVNNPKKSGPTLNETFLGLLYPTENYKVYGYLTNTKVKFILVTTDLDVRDADVRNVMEEYHFHRIEPYEQLISPHYLTEWGVVVDHEGPNKCFECDYSYHNKCNGAFYPCLSNKYPVSVGFHFVQLKLKIQFWRNYSY
ncbi:uncharacterized protein LOC110645889 isoform X1 [Hevea brasiliensis]|uniref:uncharacterized protein LOC110645889 isoform X1 n=1 Tax=Hevea brasiliensis TaxID=3981 RepID=UPI0025EE0AD9|nr:uncharacterized protein LOC110645889 isoform X1 [Hevea brasiliensis]